jgi:hypothetical protein
VGIAHDSGNAYWYNDGWYGELVYYDFQSDHDTGGEDHDDGIVRRYTEITPTREAGVPGHMILDKSTGILYIADTGAGRVLWVDTDDTSTTTTNIMGDSTQRDSSLAEYSEITGVDNGVLASGLHNPSGIALHNDTLFVSERGNGKIRAYALDGTLLDTAQTTAQSIMGLEVGPDNKLWYVDAYAHRVIRMDPFPDIDADGIADDDDNCPNVSNPGQNGHDSDDLGDICDPDDDNDGILSDFDDCVYGDLGWTSGPGTDHDSDGCRDSANEDSDDDNDGRYDSQDGCPRGDLDWVSDSQTDHDMDGCRDDGEDLDDDGDTVCDGTITDSSCTVGAPQMDRCPRGAIGWTSSIGTDFDNDGCRDSDEDADDDDDGYLDTLDGCPKEVGTATEGMKRGCPDWDGDGWADAEDTYAFDPTQWADTDLDSYGDNVEGTNGDACPLQDGTSTADRFGCPDSDADGWSNPTGTWTTDDGADAFVLEATQWHDSDIDGYGDNWADANWNSERVVLGVGQFVSDAFQPDACPAERGYSWVDRFGCSDVDGDGMSDAADAFPARCMTWTGMATVTTLQDHSPTVALTPQAPRRSVGCSAVRMPMVTVGPTRSTCSLPSHTRGRMLMVTTTRTKKGPRSRMTVPKNMGILRRTGSAASTRTVTAPATRTTSIRSMRARPRRSCSAVVEYSSAFSSVCSCCSSAVVSPLPCCSAAAERRNRSRLCSQHSHLRRARLLHRHLRLRSHRLVR